ncbi:MAG: CvpA family protein [Planctomycetes bacterium]|nr:CvpA family protein [Planctomycetota bacterium]NBY02639.1 CvpA family protein [Planctomycetota bacterium]
MLFFTTFLLMLIVSYVFFQEGLFIAFCNFANMFLAFVFVAGIYEPFAEFLEINLKDIGVDGFEDAISMIGIFLVSFGALKILTMQLAPSVITYQHLVNNIGGALIGLFIGYFISGFLWCVMQTLPWQEKFLGFDVRSSQKSSSSAFFRPDRVWLASMRKCSNGVFKTDKVFDYTASFELRYQRYRRVSAGKVAPQFYVGDIDFNATQE